MAARALPFANQSFPAVLVPGGAGLSIGREAIAIEYVVDMAEIPALQELSSLDANGNGEPDSTETDPYHPAQCQRLASALTVNVNGQPAARRAGASAIEFPPGAGNLLTLRLTCMFDVTIAPSDGDVQIEFTNGAYSDRIGWREIVVEADAVALQGEFATSSVSQKLRAYPQDLLSSPLDQRQVTVTLLPPGAQPSGNTEATSASNGSVESVAFPWLNVLAVSGLVVVGLFVVVFGIRKFRSR